MRVLRIYHGGRDPAHRARELALAAAGVDMTLLVPAAWPGSGPETSFESALDVRELPVRRPGDVNRHSYVEADALASLIRELRPDVLDLHEEPVSTVAHQVLRLASPTLPVAMYTAQNLDKRFPPPFSYRERHALGRVDALYPCAQQSAAVARGKGFPGLITVLPLGLADADLAPGSQTLDQSPLVIGLVGRLVPEKGVQDAVRVLAALAAARPTRLVLVGSGPEGEAARSLAAELGVADCLELVPWVDRQGLRGWYRRMHAVLVPSRSTGRWVEQFGRVIVEAQAAGVVVAGYATGSIAEVLGETGILVPDGDHDLLARGLAGLLGDPKKWADARDAGWRASAQRSWSVIAARQAEMYAELLRRGAGPRRTLPVPTAWTRARAVAEFGPPATAAGQARPFALPVLRDRPDIAGPLGAVVDGALAVVTSRRHDLRPDEDDRVHRTGDPRRDP